MANAVEQRVYQRHEAAVFKKTTERFGGLSNMAPGYPLTINGVYIRTSEALYQACRFPHLPDVQRLIIGQRSPMTAKMKSKPYRDNSRPDWDVVRVRIMRWCLRVKLAQNWEHFSRLLLATGDCPIVEESRRDAFWGAKRVDEETLMGANVLGRLLMELREKLRGIDTAELRVVSPPSIDGFLLYGKEIGVITAVRDPLGQLNRRNELVAETRQQRTLVQRTLPNTAFFRVMWRCRSRSGRRSGGRPGA